MATDEEATTESVWESKPGGLALTEGKLAAEIDKLRSETEKLRADARHPWLKVGLAALLTSLGAGAGGYLFGDSLKARSQAEIRKEVLKTYFSIDNNVLGKRKQVLTFIRSTLSNDDPELAAWLNTESAVVDRGLQATGATVADLQAQAAKAEQEGRTDEAKSLREQILSLLKSMAAVAPSDPLRGKI